MHVGEKKKKALYNIKRACVHMCRYLRKNTQFKPGLTSGIGEGTTHNDYRGSWHSRVNADTGLTQRLWR